MAIEKMKFISLTAGGTDLDDVLVKLIHTDMMHPVLGSKIAADDPDMHLIDSDKSYLGYAQTLKNILHTLNYTLQEQKEYKAFSKEEITAFIKRVSDRFGINNDSANVLMTKDDETALAQLSELGFDRIHQCQYLNFGFGRLPMESVKKLGIYEDDVFVFHKLHTNKQYCWLVYVTSDTYAAQIEEIFKGLYFESIEIPMIDTKKELATYGPQMDEVYSYCIHEQMICDMNPYIVVQDQKYTVNGFVKAADTDMFKQSFNTLPVSFDVKEPNEVENIECPTLLKNCWFAKPFELFVSMYSLPKYGTYDPTFFLAITYCLIFGIMFGDMGQGLVLLILGLVLEKKGALFGIIGRCGITSTVFGFLFGSVFGYEDLLTPVHQALFGTKDKLFDVLANENTMTLLLGAVALGAILTIIVQTINVAENVKKKKWGDVLFSQNGLAGLLFYVSIMVAVAAMMLGINVINPIYIAVCFVLPVICFIMKEPLSNLVEGRKVKPSEGWGGYIMQSIFEMIEILLSFVTNTMSYLRVGGFVLSHAGMMVVVMTLVKMTGGAGPIVLVIGNAFVMLLEGLIVGIQSLRLEYYEMFSRYYDGGGKPFKTIAEEIKL